jgi:GH15 family glucan-1,4-alpha-glucosidase
MRWLATVATVALGAALLGGSAAAEETRTWTSLTTGNGFGFQIYSSNANQIVEFLEHPYRYLGPNPKDPHAEGVLRRNLVVDFYFGIRQNGAGGWLNAPTAAGEVEYVDQSHIIHAPAKLGSVQADSYFFAPFDFPGNALIALVKAPGASDAFALFNFHLGAGGTREAPDAVGETLRGGIPGAPGALVESGPGGGFMVYVPLSGVDHADCTAVHDSVIAGKDLGDNHACSGTDVVPGFQKKLGADGWMAVAAAFVDSSDPADADATALKLVAWANGRTPAQLLASARAEFEAWRKPPPASLPLCSGDEQRLWRQSEAVLRMAQIREPNTPTRFNHGMILASLPPGMWHIAWVRDGSYATVALARMGHFAEAKASLDFMLNAQPVGGYASYVNNQTYRISLTRYFGNGQEECDWSGNGPNTETDGWGLFLWAARQYVDASGDTAWLSSPSSFGAVYDVIRDQVAAPLTANLQSNSVLRADSSIWEVHQPGKHYAYSSLAAARGVCDMAALTAKAGRGANVPHYQQLAAQVKAGVLGNFLDGNRAIAGSLEGLANQVYADGAVAEALNWSLLPDPKGAIAQATLDLFAQLRVVTGGFERNNDGLSYYDSDEWIAIDLRVADALRRAGRAPEADAQLQRVVAKAAINYYLLPELYNTTTANGALGDYAGSIPMVGYGAGAYVMTLLDRGGIGEPNDCGDGKSVPLPAFSCASLPDGGSGASDLGTRPHLPSAPGPGDRGGCQCQMGCGSPALGVLTLLALVWLIIRLYLRARAAG